MQVRVHVVHLNGYGSDTESEVHVEATEADELRRQGHTSDEYGAWSLTNSAAVLDVDPVVVPAGATPRP